MSQKSTPKLKKTEIAIILLCILVPAIFGIISGDLLVGGALFASGLLTSYLASIQKRAKSIFGLINAVLIAYVAFKNNLFGSFFINVFIFAPLEVYGFITWGHHLDTDKNVKIRKLTLKKAITLITTCIIGSIVSGYILAQIPSQQLAFMDSLICCIDICALIIMNLRYQESWWLWVISGALSIIVWVIALGSGGESAFMRLLSAIGFLLVNIYGLVRWAIKLNKKPSRSN